MDKAKGVSHKKKEPHIREISYKELKDLFINQKLLIT